MRGEKFQSQELKRQLLALDTTLHSLEKQLPEGGIKETVKHALENSATLQRRLNDYDQYRIKVSLIGHFSSGKSSLINAILGVDLLDVDITPETDKAYELFNSPEEIEELIKEGDLEIARLGHPELLKDLKRIVLVDLPGLSADDPSLLTDEKLKKIFKAHTHVVERYILNADYALVVNDASRGTLTKEIVDFIKAKMFPPFSVVLNKADLVKDPKKREELKKHILSELEPEKPCRVFFVSTLPYEREGIDELINYLKHLQNDNYDLFRLQKFGEEILNLLEVIINELESILFIVNIQSEELEEKLKALSEKLKEKEEQAEERIEITRRAIKQLVDNTLSNLRTCLFSESRISYWAKNPDRYEEDLKNCIDTELTVFARNLHTILEDLEKDFRSIVDSVDSLINSTVNEIKTIKTVAEFVKNLKNIKKIIDALEKILKIIKNLKKLKTVQKILSFIRKGFKANPLSHFIDLIIGWAVNKIVEKFIKDKIRNANKDIYEQIKNELEGVLKELDPVLDNIKQQILNSFEDIRNSLTSTEEEKKIVEQFRGMLINLKTELENTKNVLFTDYKTAMESKLC